LRAPLSLCAALASWLLVLGAVAQPSSPSEDGEPEAAAPNGADEGSTAAPQPAEPGADAGTTAKPELGSPVTRLPGEPSAVADAAGELCIASFMAAQRARYAGQLLDARQHLIQCASSSCPSALRSQCGPWLTELRPLIPTIIVVAKDLLGRDTTDVRVSVDGQWVADKLDGLPIELDPGIHQLQFEHGGRVPFVRQVVLPQGKQNHEILVDFSRFEPRPEDTQPTILRPVAPLPTLAYVGLSVGAIGVLVGGSTGLIALSRAATLSDECAAQEGCSRREIDEATGFAHASTIGFAVGGAGLVTALVTLLIAWPDDEPTHENVGFTPWLGPRELGLQLRF